MQQRAGKHTGRPRRHVIEKVAVFGEPQTSAIEAVVQIKRNGKATVLRRGREIIPVKAEKIFSLARVAGQDISGEGERTVKGKRLVQLRHHPPAQRLGDFLAKLIVFDNVIEATFLAGINPALSGSA